MNNWCEIVIFIVSFRNFKNGDLLHVGITNSEGKIFEFDENGLQASTGIEWDDCLAIKIGNDVNSYALDQALNEAMLSTTWINSEQTQKDVTKQLYC